MRISNLTELEIRFSYNDFIQGKQNKIKTFYEGFYMTKTFYSISENFPFFGIQNKSYSLVNTIYLFLNRTEFLRRTHSATLYSI